MDGRTVDKYGEAHQGSLLTSKDTQRLNNLDRSFLGIVLRTYTSDDYKNRLAQHFSDRHGFAAMCEVLITNDGRNSAFWRVSHVMVVPSNPSGLDDFTEQLPRASSQFVTGENFNISLSESDINDLDGDWCVVNFIGGNVNMPYISNYWPSPRNTFDPQTSGQGYPTSDGVGQALVQNTRGRSRYFKRINGVEHVINSRGDIFISTHYAGGNLTPNSEGVTERGRFSRTSDPNVGGGIRVNVKPTQTLELNWNEQIDGIGIGDAFDPTLPQTNPPQTDPVPTGNKSNLFVQLLPKSVIVETPSLFLVKSSDQISLDSVGELDFNVGTRYTTAVSGIMNTVVAGDVLLRCTDSSITTVAELGDIVFQVDEANFLVTAKEEINLESTDSSIDISSAINITFSALSIGFNSPSAGISPQIILGDPLTATDPVLLGGTYQTTETALMDAIGIFATAIGAATPLTPDVAVAATALNVAITAWKADLVNSLSTTVTVGV